MQNKISKILHFLWIGDEIPQYGIFSMDAFKKMNPDFEIRLFMVKMNELVYKSNANQNCPRDKILERTFNRLFNNKNDDYIQEQLDTYGENVRFIQIFSDVLRIEILNEYGGIYLDLDTFPVKQFDDSLLSKNFFVVKNYEDGAVFVDNFFIGMKKQMHVTNPFSVPDTFYIDNTSKQQKIKFIVNKRRFFNQQLKIGDFSFSKEIYVDHYQNRGWKDSGYGIKVPKCIYDEDDSWKK